MQAFWAMILLALSGQVAIQDAGQVALFDFTGPEASQQWQAVNDGVMGGVSDGRFKITPEKLLSSLARYRWRITGALRRSGASLRT